MTVLFFLVSALIASAVCHEPLTNGTSKGPNYSTFNTALVIPSVKFSLSARRYSTADGLVFWLRYTAKAGDVLDVRAGSGAALANVVLRGNAYVFGPGLKSSYKPSHFRVPVPTGPKFGYKFYKGGSTLSNCKWLTTARAKAANTVVTYNGVKRCGTYNNITGAGNFPFLDGTFTAPSNGTYFFAYFLSKTWNAAWSINPGNISHSHDENKELPTPPLGNAPEINPAALNNTVTSALFGVEPYSFNLKK